jgi:cation transport regulator
MIARSMLLEPTLSVPFPKKGIVGGDDMPYKTTKELPETVQKVLPSEAQDVYLGAFNGAYEEYADPKKRTQGGTREAVAHAVAWSTVKKKFRKNEKDRWVKI